MGIRRILVPTDFSPHSEQALEQAVGLATKCGASLTILHVVDINSQLEAGTAKELMAGLWENGSAQLAQLARSMSDKVQPRLMIEEGLPWEVIVQRSCGFDLMVLGQSRARAWRPFSQKTAQRVVHGCRCPVLVMKA